MVFRFLIVSFLFYAFSYDFYAQCPSAIVLQNRLTEIDKIQNDTIALGRLLKLHNLCKNCVNKNDTVFALIDYKISREFHLFKDDLYSAIRYMEFCEQTLLKLTIPLNSKLLINTYYFLGQNYLFIDNKEKALYYLGKTIEQINKQSFFYERASTAYKNQSEIYLKLGDYYNAINKSELGIRYGTKAHDLRYTAQNTYIQALAYFELKNYIKAEEKINNLIELVKKNSPTDYDLGSYYSFQGDIISKKGEFNRALLSYQKAEKVLKFHNYPPDVGQVYDDVGIMYLNAKDYKQALKYFDNALKLVIEKEDKITVLTNIAKTHSNLNNTKQAIKYYQLANKYVGDFKKSLHKDIILDLFTTQANLSLNLSKNKIEINSRIQFLNESLKKLEVADKLIDYMRYEHTGTQSKYFWRNKTHSTYESAIETCYLLKDYEKAFYFFEKSRSVLLNDKLNELGAKQKLSEEDLQKEKDFQKQIAELNASIEKAQNTKQKSDLNNKLIDLQEQQDHFVKTLETKNPAYYQIKYDTPNYNLKQIQSYLGVSGGSLVEYFVGDSTTYAIVISPNAVSLKKLNFKVNNTQQFTNLCSKKITTKTELSTFLRIGSEVYKSLVLPLNLPKGHLIISQDGAFLPFEALSKSINKPDYLLNDFMISYTYSAEFLLRNKPKNYFLPNHKFIGVAPVNFTQKLNPLNGSDKSIDNIAKRYFWSNQLIGKEGSKKAFLSHAKSYQIVQIYTHAFADSNETEPRIYFADSALKVSDLSMEDQFKTNLLVLSACKTGVGKVAKGEGILSLARGFSMAGIPSTITSLWSIEDRDTYTLTELFYKYLQEGLPKDEALQKAKIEFIASTENAMPNAWAGMVLVGDNSPLEKNNSLIYGILGGLLVGGVGFWRFKKGNT